MTGGLDFSQLHVNLSGEEYESLAAAKEAGAATLNYGAFINVVVNFVIIAFAIFMVIKVMNAAKRKEEDAPAALTTKECGACLMEIPIEATKCGHCTSAVTA